MNKRTHGSSRYPGKAKGKGGDAPRRIPFGPVRFLLGSVLIVAGALTLHQLYSEASDEGLKTLLLMTYAEAEVLGGLWMVLGIAGARTRWWATAGFAGLALARLLQAWDGWCSCGCFGSLPLNPWLALVFDLAAVAALLGSRVPEDAAEDRPTFQLVHWLVLGAFTLLVGFVGSSQSDLVTVAGRLTENGRPLEGASVTFTGPSGKILLVTDGEGRFRLPLVRPGLYALWVPGAAPSPTQSRDKGGPKPSKKGETRAPQRRPLVWIEIPKCPEHDRLIEL